MARLSVLICHKQERRDQLSRLLTVMGNHPDVEIVVDGNEYRSIGEKRNVLFQKATGQYIAYVDDDDVVVQSYLNDVLGALSGNPDVVGITGIILHQYNVPRRFTHSIRCTGWYTGEGDATYYRTPNHLNPIKREIFAEVGGFNPRRSYGEDIEYSKAILPYLKTEAMIEDHPIYYYLCSIPPFKIRGAMA